LKILFSAILITGGGYMKNRITKKVKKELKQIIDSEPEGYWSKKARNYISQFAWVTAQKLHKMAKMYNKYGYGL